MMTVGVENIKGAWSLVRLDIRTPTTNSRRPVARAELHHAERGRVTGLANGVGPMDALFNAISSACCLEGTVNSFAAILTPEGFSIELELRSETGTSTGIALADDLAEGCATAYLAALERLR